MSGLLGSASTGSGFKALRSLGKLKQRLRRHILSYRTTHTLAPSPPSSSTFVVIDACVLMSSIMRRLLLRLADGGLFQPVWTERIGDEWRRNAARIWSLPPEQLDQQWADMNQRFPSANESNIEPYESILKYSDPKDFHVIAAGLARRARCGLQITPTVHVLTWNLKDFSRSELRRQNLDVYTPDRLLAHWWQDNAAMMQTALDEVPADYVALGRDPETLPFLLHRERLYRLKNLVVARLAQTT